MVFAMKTRFLPTKPKGLGDVIHHYVAPVAHAIDKATAWINRPTNLGNCGGCAKRRDALNAAIPFTSAPPKN